MKNKIIILSLLFLFIICIGTASANCDDGNITNDNTIQLSNEDNHVDIQAISENEITAAGDENSFTALEEKINSGGNVIDLNHDYTHNYSAGDKKGYITISKNNLIINGKGHTLNALNNCSVFEIKANNVTLKNIIIKDIQYTGNSGSVLITGNDAKLINVTFTNTKVPDSSYQNNYKGALRITGNNSLISDCSFINNIATSGGAIYIYNAEKFTIQYCKFQNNTAKQPTSYGGTQNIAYGGAIYINNAKNGIILNSSFTKSKADRAGAIYIRFAENCNIVNSTFTDNTAKANNDIFIGGVNCSVLNCNIEYMDNSFTTLKRDITYGGNIVELTQDYICQYGDDNNYIIISKNNTIINGNGHILDTNNKYGLFRITGKNVTLKNMIITNNWCKSSYGSVLWNGENGNLVNVTFINNYEKLEQSLATGEYPLYTDSGVLYVSGNNFTALRCNFINNTGKYYGGAITIKSNDCKIIDSNFINNTINNRERLNMVPIGNNYMGGAIYINTQGKCTISGSTFINNTPTYKNSYDYYNGGAIYVNKAGALIIVQCNFTNNTAYSNGGALYIYNTTTCSISYSNFINNPTNSDPEGDIYVKDSKIDMHDCNIEYKYSFTDLKNDIENGGNVIELTHNYYGFTGDAHTGITLSKNNTIINGNGYVLNTAGNCNVFKITGNNITITNLSIIGGWVNEGSMASILISGNGCKLDNIKFLNNQRYTVPSQGPTLILIDASGAVKVTGANTTIQNCIFINNTALKSNGEYNLGGAILIYYAENCTITNSTFEDNSAEYGGAVYIREGKNCEISNSVFMNNYVNSLMAGSGIHIDKTKNCTITGCLFTNNTNTKYQGYAISSYDMDVNVKYNAFINSNSSQNGISTETLMPNYKGLGESNWFGSNNPTYKKGSSYLKVKLEINGNNDYFINKELNKVKVVFYDNETNEIINTQFIRPLTYYLENVNTKFEANTDELLNVNVNTNKNQFTVTAIIDNGEINLTAPVTNDYSFKTLQALIDQYGEGETITLNNNYAYNPQITGEPKTININKTLKIIANKEISASKESQIFNITADNVEIENLILSNGKSLNNGGAINWSGNNGKITNVQFINNTAANLGGAIYVSGNNMTIENCVFNQNSAKNGSAIYIIGDNAKLSSSSFNNNQITQTGGVEIYIKGAKAEIAHININEGNGIGIYIDGNDATVDDVTVTNPSRETLIIKGSGAKITNITGGNPDEVFVFPKNLTDNNPSFGIEGLGSDATGNFTIIVNGTSYASVLVKNGQAHIAITDMMPGKYNITLTYSNDIKYKAMSKSEIVIVPNVELKPEEVFILPTNITPNSTIEIKLPKDANGTVELIIDGKLYNTTNLTNGTLNITLPKTTPGTHNITIKYSGDKKYNSTYQTFNITVPNPVITLTGIDLNVLYSGQAIYKVLVLSDGKNIADGENVTITFNGVKQTVKTLNGYATLNLKTSINIQTYTITTSYENQTITNKVVIKNIINAKKLKKLKKSKKVNKIKVSLAKVDGKYLKGKKLTLKIKGKKVATAKTNKKGVATFKIKKSKLKKFKKGKKVKATVTFGKDVVTKKIKIVK